MRHYILTSGRRRDEFGEPICGSPAEWMDELLDAGLWGGNTETPNLMGMAKGDRVVIQSADTGFVATATVLGPPRKTRRSLLRDRSCTHEVPLRVKRLRPPAQRTAAMRLAISRVDGERPRRRTWSNYFRLGVRPISTKVFGIIARG